MVGSKIVQLNATFKNIFSGLLKMDYNLDKESRLLNSNWHGKDVTEIPGIWKINGEKLRAVGCETVWISVILIGEYD